MPQARAPIVKGSDRTTLTLSKTVVAYGQENAERLSVRVLPKYHGAPGGRVIVKEGSRTLCVITLARASAAASSLPGSWAPVRITSSPATRGTPRSPARLPGEYQ